MTARAARVCSRPLREHSAVARFPPRTADLMLSKVAAYTYIAHAPEGGLSLDAYPAIRAWVARIEGLPGFVPMPGAPARKG